MASTTKKKVTFQSKGIALVGDLYLPAGFDEARQYDAVVMTPPFPQVKDQALSVYGPSLAQAGYIALGFDYNSKGESDSYHEKFRNDDDAPRKWEDLRNAISFINGKPYTKNIFSLGICGGGNIAASVVITDLRIKAYASVSGMMATDEIFLFADMEIFKESVRKANAARQRMFDTGEPLSADYFGYDDPDYVANNPNAAPDQLEGFDYYGTARGGTQRYPNYSNVLLASANETVALNLGQHYADRIIQPYCGIVGSKAGTAISTKIFYDRVTSEKEFHEIEGASHVDLYDKPEFVDQAVEKLVAFFDKHR